MNEPDVIHLNLYPNETVEQMEALIEDTRYVIRNTRHRSVIAMHQRELEWMKSALHRKRACMKGLHEAIKSQK